MTKTVVGKVARIGRNASKSVEPVNRASAERSLTLAFSTFAQAAGSLEKSYTHLQTEVRRPHQELRRANASWKKLCKKMRGCAGTCHGYWKACRAESWW
jgi:hypothetical protein